MARPLLAVASAFALGTAAGAALSPRSAAILLALATASLLAALGAARPRTGAGAILGAALALGAAGAAVEARAYDASPLRGWLVQHPDAGPVLVRGVCSADPRDSADRWVLTVDVEDVHAPPPGGPSPPRGRARIDVTGAATRPRLIEGDAVALWAELREPHRLGDPGAFDAVAQARRDGVHAVGWCKSPRLVVRPGRGDLGWLPSAAARAREWSRERLMAALPAGREQALVRAMTLGERTALDQETSETFRMAGTYHVLALSGTQVAMVAALLDWAPPPSSSTCWPCPSRGRCSWPASEWCSCPRWRLSSCPRPSAWRGSPRAPSSSRARWCASCRGWTCAWRRLRWGRRWWGSRAFSPSRADGPAGSDGGRPPRPASPWAGGRARRMDGCGSPSSTWDRATRSSCGPRRTGRGWWTRAGPSTATSTWARPCSAPSSGRTASPSCAGWSSATLIPTTWAVCPSCCARSTCARCGRARLRAMIVCTTGCRLRSRRAARPGGRWPAAWPRRGTASLSTCWGHRHRAVRRGGRGTTIRSA